MDSPARQFVPMLLRGSLSCHVSRGGLTAFRCSPQSSRAAASCPAVTEVFSQSVFNHLGISGRRN